MMTLSQQLEELMEFNSARILRVRQSDSVSDLHIATYLVGEEYWMALIESHGEEDYSTVYLSGEGLNALIQTLNALPIKGK